MSIYPPQIDTPQSLPIVVDNLTVVNAALFNSYRSAIIQLETTLGTTSTGNVAGRLTTLEGIVNNLFPITINGDLGGNLSSQVVIGIQGRPVSSQAPVAAQVLTWNGIVWAPTTLTSGNFILGGDLTGTTTDQVVIGIQ